jgi:hypothetical protein
VNIKLLEAERALVKMPALTMDGRTKKKGKGISHQSQGKESLVHTLDARALHRDYVRALSRSSGWSKEARVVGWNRHSDNQGTTDIEKEDAPEDTANGLNDIATRAFCFRSGAALEHMSQQPW